ncbi:hypothetical protein DE146DRAFT_357645 [Phaeosphaeria sp. MPI-PUGE-AT-0046c]|nr:hypothetical protein DE146DRAFT_357645 [Phaeosphaeria sp. MPI-PUGE-AT-0046c]
MTMSASAIWCGLRNVEWLLLMVPLLWCSITFKLYVTASCNPQLPLLNQVFRNHEQKTSLQMLLFVKPLPYRLVHAKLGLLSAQNDYDHDDDQKLAQVYAECQQSALARSGTPSPTNAQGVIFER